MRFSKNLSLEKKVLNSMPTVLVKKVIGLIETKIAVQNNNKTKVNIS